MRAPPIVETPRLVLSAPTPADAELMFARYAGDPRVTTYLGWPTHRTVDDTRGFLAFSARQWEREGAGPYLIWSGGDGRLLGSTGLGLEHGDRAVTGYVLARDAWGLGYATEALIAMVDVATDMGVGDLYALCHPAHQASSHVLEKCGFQRDEGWTQQMEFPNLTPGSRQRVVCYRRWLVRRAR